MFPRSDNIIFLFKKYVTFPGGFFVLLLNLDLALGKLTCRTANLFGRETEKMCQPVIQIMQLLIVFFTVFYQIN